MIEMSDRTALFLSADSIHLFKYSGSNIYFMITSTVYLHLLQGQLQPAKAATSFPSYFPRPARSRDVSPRQAPRSTHHLISLAALTPGLRDLIRSQEISSTTGTKWWWAWGPPEYPRHRYISGACRKRRPQVPPPTANCTSCYHLQNQNSSNQNIPT